MKLRSLFSAISYIYKCKKNLTRPRPTDILIYDKVGAADLAFYFKKHSYSIFECRGETINITVLFYALIKYGYKIDFEKYALTYIKIVDPKLVVTFIDNTITFYKFKAYCPDIKFVSVQNGYRDNYLFETLLDNGGRSIFSADVIFCFGTAVSKLYKRSIETHIIAHGSLKNNKVAKSESVTVYNKLGFISQYRPPVFYKNTPTMPIGETFVPWNKFYSTELLLLPLLFSFCKKNDLTLTIFGTSFKDGGSEFKFYSKLLENDGWEYSAKSNVLDSYQKLYKVDSIVFIDSTLGYEALGRGLKCIAFPSRGSSYLAEDRRFGWPADLTEDGPFWTSQVTEDSVFQLLNYVTKVNKEEWELIITPVVENLMSFDEGNTQFIEIINQSIKN